MEQFHLRLTREHKRQLQTIAKENNESMNGVISLAIERYIADYFSESESKKAVPQLE
ncbi:Arc family DNA-binding protein, partial [Staphylococcus pseudintermedius]|nr:Arc family DNA-binding protein [Staphylococcus pseudintermedius]